MLEMYLVDVQAQSLASGFPTLDATPSAPPLIPLPEIKRCFSDCGIALPIPDRLSANCRNSPERASWLAKLPVKLEDLKQRWALSLDEPFGTADVSCGWVAPVQLVNGRAAVLKLSMPHMEGEHEIAGLRFWNGDPTVRLLEADDHLVLL
jgi:Aminoglycoside/hydroxyurea antibiotic resistance kinase